MAYLNSLAQLAKKGRTIVVGSKVYPGTFDRRKLYKKAVGVDMLAGDGVDLVHDMEHPLEVYEGKVDHIDLCSVLEHVRRPWLLAKNVEALLKTSGTILVSVPFVWRMHAYPNDYWRMNHAALEVLFPNIEWLEKKYVVNGMPVRMPLSYVDQEGGKWLSRSETVAFGRKCSMS